MKKGNPITVRRYHPQHGVVHLDRPVSNIGAIKIAGRAVRNLGLNSYVPRQVNALGEISAFLSKNAQTSPDQIYISPRQTRYNPFGLIYEPLDVKLEKDSKPYRLYKKKDDFYLWVEKSGFLKDRMLHLKADGEEDFRKKLSSILNSDTARAKLEYRVSSLPGLTSRWSVPGLPRHSIEFAENKMTGEYQEPAYTLIGRDGDVDAFDSPVGGIARRQLTYFAPDCFENNSSTMKEKLKVRDQTWAKLTALTQYTQGSSEPDELLGNIIMQTYAGQDLDPKHTAEMTHQMKEDFLYNLNGFGTRNGKVGTQAIPYGRYGHRWPLGEDPLRGGRFWEDIPPSLEEIVLMMYQPQADGSTKLRYDDDADAFLKQLAKRLAIRPDDRQYTMNYGRKALGVKTAMRLLREELSKINLTDPDLPPQERERLEKKWSDLTALRDTLFNNSGDMRDFLRKGEVGFPAYAEAVAKEEIPPIKTEQGRVNEGVPSAKGFQENAIRGMFDFTENYTYYEKFWGWQGREYLGRVLHKAFRDRIFKRDIPDVVAETAVAMFVEAVDKTSRRLKLFNDIFIKDGDLATNVLAAGDRFKRLDIQGGKKILSKQVENFREILSGREEYARTNVKRMIMQNEGVAIEKEIWPTFKLDNEGDKNGLFNGNYPAHRVVWRQSSEYAEKLMPFFTDIARIMKAHQEGMINNGEDDFDPYKSVPDHVNPYEKVYHMPEMRALGAYIQSTSKEMAVKFFERNEIYYRQAEMEDLEPLFKHVRSEFANVLRIAVNVVAMVSYNGVISE